MSRLTPLFTSVAILLLGHGLQLSLLPLRADAMGWSSSQIGLSSSFYFGGFLLGCFSIPGFVRAVGHIRVFTVLTSIMTAALLCLSIFERLVAWLLLRLIIGWSIAGLYLVIESWLNEEVGNEQRGSLLSLYTIVVLSAMAGGQLLLNLADPTSFHLVIIASMCIALAAVPVGLTQIAQPGPVPPANFSPFLIFRTAREAAVSSFAAGVVMGCFYGLGPVFAAQLGLNVSGISIMMGAGITGGALFQWPLGRLSDRMDRRVVILLSMLAATGICALITIAAPAYLPHLVFLFGACVMPIYALSLAHAGDNVEGSFLEVGTGILIVNAVGATIGPVLASLAMEVWGARSFFVFCGATILVGAFLMLFYTRRRPALRPHFSRFELATTASAQGAIELDPRSDEDCKDSKPID